MGWILYLRRAIEESRTSFTCAAIDSYKILIYEGEFRSISSENEHPCLSILFSLRN